MRPPPIQVHYNKSPDAYLYESVHTRVNPLRKWLNNYTCSFQQTCCVTNHPATVKDLPRITVLVLRKWIMETSWSFAQHS